MFDQILAWTFISFFFIVGGFLLAMIGRTVYQMLTAAVEHGKTDWWQR